MKAFWSKCYEYRRILEILSDYWLTVPDEKRVVIEMHFEKADGQTQYKRIVWRNREHD